jgi:hypothetical protein
MKGAVSKGHLKMDLEGSPSFIFEKQKKPG